MAFFLITYSIILVVVILVVFIELVSHKVIFAGNRTIQRFFGHPMLRYSLRRIGSALISVLLAVIVTFLLIRASIGDPLAFCADKVMGQHKWPPEVLAARCDSFLRESGLHGNIFEQLGSFLFAILPFPKVICSTSTISQGATYYMYVEGCRPFIMDLGKVYDNFPVTGTMEPAFVIDVIFGKMAVSFPIMLAAVGVSLALGYPLGIMMARHKDGVIDHVGNAYIVSVSAIPGVAYYYIWMALFVGILHLPGSYDASNFLSWLPPVLTVGFTGLTGIAFWVRRYMINEFSSDYVKFARAKGLSEQKIVRTHVLRNAVVPLARMFPAAVLGSLMGSFFIEQIYTIPGIGGMLMAAASSNEVFAIQGIVIVSALISVVSYLLGDIATAFADPRVRLMKE